MPLLVLLELSSIFILVLVSRLLQLPSLLLPLRPLLLLPQALLRCRRASAR